MMKKHKKTDIDEVPPTNEPMQGIEEGNVVEISINIVVGFSTLGTMKIKGQVGDLDRVILVDCRATHNFISQKIVEKLNLPLLDTGHYGVIMGSGLAIKGKGMCKVVIVRLQEIVIIEDFLTISYHWS